MTKDEMTTLLRSVGVNENTVTAMENAYEMGVANERERCEKICDKHAEVHASLPNMLSTDAAWAACIDLRDAIKKGDA